MLNNSRLESICPKLPMRNKAITKDFYLQSLDFTVLGDDAYPQYLIMKKDGIEIHFFEFSSLQPLENYGQVYIRTQNIENFYQYLLDKKTKIHPNGALKIQPWGLKEFSILDPDHNLLTFGEAL